RAARPGGAFDAPPRRPAPPPRRWLTDGTAEHLVAWQRAEMDRRFAMAERVLGPCTAVRSLRTGGLHAWIALNDPWTALEVVELAQRLGILLSPTSHFHADADSAAQPVARGVRLCLGNAPDPVALDEAIPR